MCILKVEPNYVAHFQAKLQRLYFSQVVIILPELPKIELDLAIVRHSFTLLPFLLRQVRSVCRLKTG